jgi:hypothetical protein
VYASVVTQVNHLHAFRLQDSAHDIDGRVVPVKKGSCCNDPEALIGMIHKTI